jgi:chromosomal replication initiator protein
LHSDSKQIIISSDRSPNDLNLLADRLKTRFYWGLTVNILPPDYNLKVEILRRKILAANLELNISDEIIDYIASNIGNDVRKLEGAITRLVAYAAIMGNSEVNLEITVDALKELISNGECEKDDIHRIQKIVAEEFQITVDDIRSKKRSSNISFPRQIAMYLCRMLTTESFPKIGTDFGGKDHSTVMHSVEKIEKEMKTNPDLAKIVDKLTKKIKGC